jgi:GT2 family glycosyltransferase
LVDISIIIVNFRGWKRLSQCLDSLNTVEDNRFSHEVIVVDNNSDDGMIDSFRQQFPRFAFILNDGNFGFANGCNRGAKNSQGSYLLFLNPDTIVSAKAIFAMFSEALVRKAYSIISCSQVKADGSEERPYGSFLSPSNLTGWLRAVNKIVFHRKEKQFPQTDNFLYPDWVSGSVVMLSKQSYNDLGGWNDDFWMYYEDVDLCRRARLKGGDIVLVKSVNIEHNHGGASRINKKVTALTKTCVNISRHVYISKHEKGLQAVYMHTFLILDNVLFGILPALAGTVLFFIDGLNVIALTYIQLIAYYLNVLKSGTWLSKRSVNYVPKR